MINLNERQQIFTRRVTSLRVIYDSLHPKEREIFLKTLKRNSFKKFFENERFSILNIRKVKNAPNHYYYTFDKKDKRAHIILKVSDLKIINKNLKLLFNKQTKERDNSHGTNL